MALLLLAIAASLFMAVYGALMAWRPERFLEFHDTFVDRNKRHHDAEWRNEIGSPASKLIGCMFVVVGLVFAAMLTVRLLSTMR